MTVHPHLRRVGEVRADLDERRAEVVVEDVRVVDADPAVLLLEPEARWPGLSRAFVAREHRLVLLRDTDGDHTGGCCLLQERPHDVGLAVVLAEAHERDVVGLGEGHHRLTEPCSDPVEEGRRDRVAEVLGEERDHLATDLQVGNVRVEVDMVEALEVEGDMASRRSLTLGTSGMT